MLNQIPSISPKAEPQGLDQMVKRSGGSVRLEFVPMPRRHRCLLDLNYSSPDPNLTKLHELLSAIGWMSRHFIILRRLR